jgi:glycerol-3-phosphate dehydrogenase
VLRGFRATLLEKGELLSGTTGRHHGLLHSGARYAVNDPEAARECIQENTILRRITSDVLEPNDGLFVALTDEDEGFLEDFLEGCSSCGIPTRVLPPEDALRLEPHLNPALRVAVQVPDATMDAWRLPLQFLATAKHNGADIRPFSEVVGFVQRGGTVEGVRVRDHATDVEYELKADLVVSATGAWGQTISTMVGGGIGVRPAPGVMVAMRGRITNMAISRLQLPGDGDVIVPQRNLSIIGTSNWTTDDPENLTAPPDDISRMVDLTSELIPAVREMPMVTAWAAARPLFESDKTEDSRRLSRTFRCLDLEDEGISGLLYVVGGKATVLRAMAETTVDLVCSKLSVDVPCRTHSEPLLSYRSFYLS